jgi:hypothetical protein
LEQVQTHLQQLNTLSLLVEVVVVDNSVVEAEVQEAIDLAHRSL